MDNIHIANPPVLSSKGQDIPPLRGIAVDAVVFDECCYQDDPCELHGGSIKDSAERPVIEPETVSTVDKIVVGEKGFPGTVDLP